MCVRQTKFPALTLLEKALFFRLTVTLAKQVVAELRCLSIRAIPLEHVPLSRQSQPSIKFVFRISPPQVSYDLIIIEQCFDLLRQPGDILIIQHRVVISCGFNDLEAMSKEVAPPFGKIMTRQQFLVRKLRAN